MLRSKLLPHNVVNTEVFNMKDLSLLSDKKSRVWRWNVDPAWTNFSTMIQEHSFFNKSRTEFERHRASKTCLYFGVASVEAFINKDLRSVMRKNGYDEDSISSILSQNRKKTEKQNLLKASPFGVIFDDEKYKIFVDYKKIRNEITHPSRPDQLIYDYIEIVNVEEFVDIVKYILVKICELQGKEFKYWMLGWNYIGFNHSEIELSLEDNLQSFYWSLQRMCLEGFNTVPQEDFLKKYMTGYIAFIKMQKKMDECPFDIEPKNPIFSPPRLTRCWWEHSILVSDSIGTCEDDLDRPGSKIVWAVVNDSIRNCLGYFNTKEKAEYVCKVCHPECRVTRASYCEKNNNITVL